jgi:hypothetical protein
VPAAGKTALFNEVNDIGEFPLRNINGRKIIKDTNFDQFETKVLYDYFIINKEAFNFL